MPLGINGYNDAFKAFTDFAAHAKSGSTFAQISGEKNEAASTGPLAGRTIVAKTGFDFVGNVGRSGPGECWVFRLPPRRRPRAMCRASVRFRSASGIGCSRVAWTRVEPVAVDVV